MNAATVLLVCALAIIEAPFPVRVVDGDTVDRSLWRYRLAGFDAPELRRALCPNERLMARRARDRLQELIRGGSRVDLIPDTRSRDPWRRIVARLVIDGVDVAEIAIREGWGAPYSGRGTKPIWCHSGQ